MLISLEERKDWWKFTFLPLLVVKLFVSDGANCDGSQCGKKAEVDGKGDRVPADKSRHLGCNIEKRGDDADVGGRKR